MIDTRFTARRSAAFLCAVTLATTAAIPAPAAVAADSDPQSTPSDSITKNFPDRSKIAIVDPVSGVKLHLGLGGKDFGSLYWLDYANMTDTSWKAAATPAGAPLSFTFPDGAKLSMTLVITNGVPVDTVIDGKATKLPFEALDTRKWGAFGAPSSDENGKTIDDPYGFNYRLPPNTKPALGYPELNQDSGATQKYDATVAYKDITFTTADGQPGDYRAVFADMEATDDVGYETYTVSVDDFGKGNAVPAGTTLTKFGELYSEYANRSQQINHWDQYGASSKPCTNVPDDVSAGTITCNAVANNSAENKGPGGQMFSALNTKQIAFQFTGRKPNGYGVGFLLPFEAGTVTVDHGNLGNDQQTNFGMKVQSNPNDPGSKEEFTTEGNLPVTVTRNGLTDPSQPVVFTSQAKTPANGKNYEPKWTCEKGSLSGDEANGPGAINKVSVDNMSIDKIDTDGKYGSTVSVTTGPNDSYVYCSVLWTAKKVEPTPTPTVTVTETTTSTVTSTGEPPTPTQSTTVAEPTPDKPGDTPGGDTPSGDKPGDTPGGDTPGGDKPGDNPGSGTTGSETPGTTTTIPTNAVVVTTTETVTETSWVKPTPTTTPTVTVTTTENTTITKTGTPPTPTTTATEPTPDTPGGDKPGGDTPGGDTPSGDKPGGDTPGGDTPSGDKPGGDTPGEDKPGGNTTAPSTTIPDNAVVVTTTVTNTATEWVTPTSEPEKPIEPSSPTTTRTVTETTTATQTPEPGKPTTVTETITPEPGKPTTVTKTITPKPEKPTTVTEVTTEPGKPTTVTETITPEPGKPTTVTKTITPKPEKPATVTEVTTEPGKPATVTEVTTEPATPTTVTETDIETPTTVTETDFVTPPTSTRTKNGEPGEAGEHHEITGTSSGNDGSAAYVIPALIGLGVIGGVLAMMPHDGSSAVGVVPAADPGPDVVKQPARPTRNQTVLAVTGADTTGWALLALLLVGAGAVTLVTRRKFQ